MGNEADDPIATVLASLHALEKALYCRGVAFRDVRDSLERSKLDLEGVEVSTRIIHAMCVQIREGRRPLIVSPEDAQRIQEAPDGRMIELP